MPLFWIKEGTMLSYAITGIEELFFSTKMSIMKKYIRKEMMINTADLKYCA